jgi:hypothetical protein
VPPTCAYRAQAVQSVRGAWFFGHNLLSGLILPQALERGVPELAIGGPGSELDLGDEVRLNPLGQILPELPRGRCRVPGAGTPDMRQLSVPILPENEGADCA